MEKIKVTQIKGFAGKPQKLIKVVKALGLSRPGQTRIHKDNNCTRGMINRVKHLVKYEWV
tara:strand:+ start:275 stop:454 length:180 start_codon:yes stop_codon:yes gene_type:complete